MGVAKLPGDREHSISRLKDLRKTFSIMAVPPVSW
jgi:hypothetical protein